MLSLLFVVPVGIGYALCMIYKTVLAAILRLARMEWTGEETLRVNIDYPLLTQLSIFLPCEGGNDVLVNLHVLSIRVPVKDDTLLYPWLVSIPYQLSHR
jgi:hypothetical protein